MPCTESPSTPWWPCRSAVQRAGRRARRARVGALSGFISTDIFRSSERNQPASVRSQRANLYRTTGAADAGAPHACHGTGPGRRSRAGRDPRRAFWIRTNPELEPAVRSRCESVERDPRARRARRTPLSTRCIYRDHQLSERRVPQGSERSISHRRLDGKLRPRARPARTSREAASDENLVAAIRVPSGTDRPGSHPETGRWSESQGTWRRGCVSEVVSNCRYRATGVEGGASRCRGLQGVALTPSTSTCVDCTTPRRRHTQAFVSSRSRKTGVHDVGRRERVGEAVAAWARRRLVVG